MQQPPASVKSDAVTGVWRSLGALMSLLALSILDYLVGEELRLHALYVFPVAVIGIYSAHIRTVIFATTLAAGLQVLVLFSYGISLQSKIFSSLVAVTVLILVAYISRAARKGYLRISEQASRDALTHLANRWSFELFLANEISRHRRYPSVFSLVMVDLDHFKELNDTHGHNAGDQALVLVADILRNNIRASDVVARLGGDEFAIMLPNTTLEDCRMFCQQLVELISKGMATKGFPVTATLGSKSFAIAPLDNADALRQADSALYQAKDRGRNCAVST